MAALHTEVRHCGRNRKEDRGNASKNPRNLSIFRDDFEAVLLIPKALQSIFRPKIFIFFFGA
jgi:hypothetical protein